MRLLFQLRPSMEHYQQAMINIMTRRASPLSISGNSPITSATAATNLTCPAGTPQDPSYLTIPFTAPSEEPTTAKQPKRPKGQQAYMFIAGNDRKLIIGISIADIIRLKEHIGL